MTLVAEWREEQVDALIVQVSDLEEIASQYPMRLPGQRARRQASYFRSKAEDLFRPSAGAIPTSREV